ncbi:MAG TPA: Fic family protein [Solirubrobacteraceae bacterium]|jgi:fido (protein-threonine AMPylation protein)|nr:Fic family protein [Solirubrobacteraceae bacterium]
MAREMERVYLAKGARASAAIEGNSLNEEQAVAAVEGNLELPESQEYLQQELQNIIGALAKIEAEVHLDGRFEITAQKLRELNSSVLADLEIEDHVVPGEFRTGPIGIGTVYKGAPPEDCEYLIDAMCDWLNGPDFSAGGDDHTRDFLHAFLRAVIAHVYIAWIHPFGDGNGRTARLVEFGILTEAGIPSVAAHLLSNHYNATRTNYYRQLDRASKSGGDLIPFLCYAAQGFVGELQEQLGSVHELIVNATWINYVHSKFPDPTTTARRQRELVLALPPNDWVPRAKLTTLSPGLAEAYATKKSKTVTRDLNVLDKLELIDRGPRGVRARREVMLSFMPRVVEGAEYDRQKLFPAIK